jgi:4-methyl-5(b-hydroxyethyl)-thiazole monophosphate biosynthesis
MVSAILFLAPGFEEIETTSIVDVLRRCGVEVTIAGTEPHAISGAHGMRFVSDILIDESNVEDSEAVICPGGNPGYMNLRKNSRVLAMIKQAFYANKLVAAICAAPAVLADSGILRNRNCTIYPGMESELIKSGGKPSKDLVVEDGNIITSQGPATALLFAFRIAERLVDKKTVDGVWEKTLSNLVLNKFKYH